MKTVLERARETAEGSLAKAERHVAEIRDQVDNAIARKAEWEEGLNDAAQEVDAAKAIISAIDAAIAAGAPAKKTKPLRIPIEFDTSGLEEALRNAAKDRVSIELDLDRPSITVGGNPLDAARVVNCLLAQDVDFATGGVTGTAPLCVVGERAGEAIASLTPTADIMASYHPERTPHPCTIRLGDEFEVLTISDRDGLVRSLGKVVEIFADGGPKDSLYRVEIERAAGWRLDYEADDRDIKERHQRISTLVPLDNLRRL